MNLIITVKFTMGIQMLIRDCNSRGFRPFFWLFLKIRLTGDDGESSYTQIPDKVIDRRPEK